MIEADQLVKTFGDFTAVHGISLQVPAGKILALLGHNGAGKTTTTRMLAAILAPTSGHAFVNGYDTVAQPLEVRRSIGHLTELPGLYNRMRAMDYLDFFGQIHQIPTKLRQGRSEELMRRFDLWDARKLRIGEFSKGMRQKTALIRALLHNPQVLFLDEPTSAMDPHSAKTVRDCIADLKATNCTIVLCTHNLFEAEALADGIAIIRKGRIIVEGTADQLKRQLLGEPHYRVQLSKPFNIGDMLDSIGSLVSLSEAGADWFTFTTTKAVEVNPLLLKLLAHYNLEVVTLSEVPRSLESVYLKIAGTPQNSEVSYDESEQMLKKGRKASSKAKRKAKAALPNENEIDASDTTDNN
jgi:ABC-2 type transport system ATP-binding protein